MCQNSPELMTAAMTINWTQNMVIMEADLTDDARTWYIQAVHQFGWSKLELTRQVKAGAHLNLALDLEVSVCYTEDTANAGEVSACDEVKDNQCDGAGEAGPADRLSPLFSCAIPGFSIEEFTPSRYWFVEGVEGPWEWRMKLARRGVVAYGKLFSRKAGLVSREWYPDLANYRCSGYDFDARYEEGLANYREKCVMDVQLREGPTLSKDLKKLAGFGGDGLKGFDSVITSLQMQTYVTVHSFEYARDKYGKPYGWGIARYAAMEDVLGADATQGSYNRDPKESKARIIDHLGQLFPEAFDDDLAKFIR